MVMVIVPTRSRSVCIQPFDRNLHLQTSMVSTDYVIVWLLKYFLLSSVRVVPVPYRSTGDSQNVIPHFNYKVYSEKFVDTSFPALRQYVYCEENTTSLGHSPYKTVKQVE